MPARWLFRPKCPCAVVQKHSVRADERELCYCSYRLVDQFQIKIRRGAGGRLNLEAYSTSNTSIRTMKTIAKGWHTWPELEGDRDRQDQARFHIRNSTSFVFNFRPLFSYFNNLNNKNNYGIIQVPYSRHELEGFLVNFTYNDFGYNFSCMSGGV